MKKRMLTCIVMGSLALVLGPGCDDGPDEPSESVPATGAATAPGTSVGPTSTPGTDSEGGTEPPPPTVPPPTSALGCKDMLDCYPTCPQGDDACMEACWSKGSPLGQQLETEMWACGQQNGCKDWQCIEQACGDELEACLCDTNERLSEVQSCGMNGQGLTCKGLFQCYEQCAAGDDACYEGCWGKGSPQGRQAENAIWACAEQHSCQDWSCVEQSCGAEIQACLQ